MFYYNERDWIKKILTNVFGRKVLFKINEKKAQQPKCMQLEQFIDFNYASSLG